MNLVKAQAIANDLPIPELQKYANGFNPNIIPPWVATGVMQEKMATQQKLSNMQGAAQGEQPSVKEQVEQKAGLMALQQQQQAQAQQAMMQQAQQRPMPVPSGIPQPGVQMASGGLARLPVNFNFQGGGIVAFSGEDGSEVQNYGDTAKDLKRQMEEAKAEMDAANRSGDRQATKVAVDRFLAAQRQLEAWEGQAQGIMQSRAEVDEIPEPTNPEEAAFMRGEGKFAPGTKDNTFRGTIPDPEAMAVDNYAEPGQFYQSPRPTPAVPPARPPGSYDQAGLNANPRARAMPEEPPGLRVPQQKPPVNDLVKAAAMAKPQGGPAKPAGLPTGLAATNPDIEAARAAAKALSTEAPTPEQTIANINTLTPDVASEGNQRAMYERQQKRIADLEAQYAKSKPSGLDDLIRVFGQAGRYKGLSGLGPAYTQNQAQKRQEDLDFQAKMNALRSGMEEKELKGATELRDTRAKAFDTERSEYLRSLQARAKSLADIAGVSQQAIDNAAKNLTSIEVAKINAAATKRGTPTEQLLDKYLVLKATNPEAAAKLLAGIAEYSQAKRRDDYLSDPDYKAAVKNRSEVQQKLATLPADSKLRPQFEAQLKAINDSIADYKGGTVGGGKGSGSGNTVSFDSLPK